MSVPRSSASGSGVRRRVLRRELLPSRGTLTLLALALILFLLGASCMVSFALFDPDVGADQAAAMFGLLVLPATALLPLIGALREKSPARRGVLWGIVALLLAAGGLGGGIGIALAPDAGIGPGVGFTTFFCGPVVVAALAPAIYFGIKGWSHVCEALRAERSRHLGELLTARGMVTLDDLGQELGLGEEDAARLVERLLAAGALHATLFREHRRVYSPKALRDAKRDVQRIVRARGQARLTGLSAEIDAPAGLIRRWLYELVDDGFTGYINWDEGVVYSAEGKSLAEAGRCPACSGELSLAGKGVIRCTYCGAEILLDAS